MDVVRLNELIFTMLTLKCNTKTVAFHIYDIDRDGFISNGELFVVLKMMVGGNLSDTQLQQIVDKSIIQGDLNGDGKIDFDEFQKMIQNTDIIRGLTLESDKV